MDLAQGLATLLLCATLLPVTYAVDKSQCIAPLGMEHGLIRDQDITASSSFDSGNVGPQHGRIRTESHGGAWCPKHQITTDPKEWLEVDLHSVHMITATGTQGRFGNGQGQEFAEAYVLEYWRPRLGKWVPYRNIKGEEGPCVYLMDRQYSYPSSTKSWHFIGVWLAQYLIMKLKGNTNTYLESKQELDPPIWASKLRFLPYSYHRRTVCMRVEIYGCYWNDGVISYSMPQGDKRGSGWEFFDSTYDGHWDGELRRGLGLLTDGKVGPDNFKMAYYDYERSQGWVGWKNDTRAGQPIEIKFEFDQVREFTAVHIYCNNEFTRDVQVFSEANIKFSVGGKYYVTEPITYSYVEDRIFENSRNVTIKLHRRVGRFVKVQLHFAAKWIMISEVTFDSDIAHGNFTAEAPPPTETPAQGDIFIENSRSELPVSTASQEDPTYMAVIIGGLTVVILLLAVVIFFIVNRHRQRKCFASPLSPKPALPCAHLQGSTSGTAEKNRSSGESYTINDFDDYNNKSTLPVLGVDKSSLRIGERGLEVKMDDYQEPYQALKYAPYYSYSTVVMEMQDMMQKAPNASDVSNYDYAVPELGTVPLLSPERVPLPPTSCNDQASSGYSNGSTNEGKRTPSQQEALNALKKRLELTVVPEFPRHRLRMLSKISDGAFGTVYVAEADGIPEYASTSCLGKRLVAVKFLLQDALEKEKQDFHRDVRILAALKDCNIARVLGVCSQEDPLSVVMEYLDHGDLCQFLRTHVLPEGERPSLQGAKGSLQGANGSLQGANDSLQGANGSLLGAKTLSFNCLLYMATQIASGMKYLESLNFVHRDLATRNCLIGKAYQIKISDFGTDNELYAADYYKVDGHTPLPIRWMAWESVFQGKYTTKSDVWAFAVTLSEILNLGRRVPFEGYSDLQVVENLAHMHKSDGNYVSIARPGSCPKDIYDLMCECWKRVVTERPSFREIHLFLQRKNLGYAPVS